MDSQKDQSPDARAGLPEKPVWLELLKLVPQLAWVGLGAILLFMFVGPVLRSFEQGNVTKLGIGPIQLEIAQKRIELAVVAKDKKLPAGIQARIQRMPQSLFNAVVLWVDDNPARNVAERSAMSALGLTVDVARTTDEAMGMVRSGSYDLIISDMYRKDDKATTCEKPVNSEDAGACDLVSQVVRYNEKKNGGKALERAQPPVIFFGNFFRPENGVPKYAFGATSRVEELFHLVLDVLERRDNQLISNKDKG